ncbi:MAG: glycosyltransferase family 4 protein [Hyphomicrobium sp.]|nr:glycosyltransferase family 4 protein [Hyphomicrobium sp.]
MVSRTNNLKAGLHIVVVMPRNMHFGPSNATSIDLCVHDLVRSSRYRETTTVVCEKNEILFADVSTLCFPDSAASSTRRKVRFVEAQATQREIDLIVVQQHLPTAVALARRLPIPIVFHTHNFTKRLSGAGPLTSAKRWLRTRSYQSLAGIIFVSNAANDRFEADWPEVTIPRAVVPNGFNFDEWHPQQNRVPEILCVGRAAPEKGIKEAAAAVARVLSQHRDWRGRFILSEIGTHPRYFDDILEVLQPVSHQTSVDVAQPWSFVKAKCEEAAIAIVASKWDEPFGRTALESHAGGCTVISSGTGGLSEVSGSNAIMLPSGFDAHDIAATLENLISEPALRRDLASRGLEYARKNFSIELVSSTADQFYDQVRSSA